MLISSVWRGVGRSYFIYGLLVGGLTMAGAISLVGSIAFQWWVPEKSRVFILVVALAVVTLVSPWILRWRYAQNRRQVPQAIRSAGPRTGAFQFGFEMGTASRTFMPTTMPYVIFIGLLFLIPLPVSLLVGLAFGVGRAVVPLLRSYNDYDLEWTEAFDRWSEKIWLGMTAAAVAAPVIALYGG
jgi:hypothetical protein